MLTYADVSSAVNTITGPKKAKELLTCPKCSGNHTLKDCTANKENYKCINFINYTKYNKMNSINENHSALDSDCPCHQLGIKKTQNTNMANQELYCFQMNLQHSRTATSNLWRSSIPVFFTTLLSDMFHYNL